MTIRYKAAIALAAFGLSAAMPAAHADWQPESSDPIRLTINEWTGQTITTHIAGGILKDMGYNVEYVVAGYFPQMIALQDGSVTAALEIWTTNIADALDNALATNNVVDLGPLGLAPVETWFYTPFAEEKCPGLPAWTALKECAEAFATIDTMPEGRLLDYPADWGTTNGDRLKALDLPFTAIPAGSEGALVAEIRAAFAREEPLLVMFFSPHWLFNDTDLRQVELPPYEDGCFDDPAVGINPDATYDCDFVRGDVRKVVWAGMKDKWPAAERLLSALTIDNEAQIPLITQIDMDGKSLEEVAEGWRNENADLIQSWVDAATK